MKGSHRSKLKPTAFAENAPQTKDEGSTGAHLRLRHLNFSVSDLVEGVRRQFDRPLLDKTGLTGGFDFTLDFEAQPPRETPPDAAAAMGLAGIGVASPLVAALREQLGLTVVPAREQVEILVIERRKAFGQLMFVP